MASGQPDVVVILCDTARADAFSPWGGPARTPAVERVCREGLVFTRAVAQAPWTLPSTATMFTGRLPTEHGISADGYQLVDGRPTSPSVVVRAYDGPWLPVLFLERGYATWAASCNPWVVTWTGFDRGFDAFLEFRSRAMVEGGGPEARDADAHGPVDAAWPARLAAAAKRSPRLYGVLKQAKQTRQRVRRVLSDEDRGGRAAAEAFGRRVAEGGLQPLFAVVNLMEVHGPYNPPSAYHPMVASAPVRWKPYLAARLAAHQVRHRKTNLRRDEAFDLAVRSLYYGAAAYEDHLIGRMIGSIEDGGRPTVVVLVSDHGENLGDHGLYGHTASLHETLLHVPLVAWGSGVNLGPATVDDPVSLLGLQAFLTGFADGEPAPTLTNGAIVSEFESDVRLGALPTYLRARMESDPSSVPPLAFEPGMSARRGNRKYVTVGQREAVYDLQADPGEEHDVLAWEPGAAEPFRPLRDAWRERRRLAAEVGTTVEQGEVADDQIAEHLKMLGYIE